MRLRFFASVLSIIVLSVVVVSVYAEDTTPSARPTTPREQMQNLREEFRTTVQEKKEEFRANMQKKKEEFIERLSTIKDARKKQLTSRINEKIATFNKNHTDRYATVLNQLQSILDRIKQKATTAKTNGKDTTALDVAVTRAQSAIDTAKAAVATQVSKEYVADIVNEETLRTTIGKTVSQFRLDLQAVHKLVIDARQAVRKVATELAKLIGEGRLKQPSATESGL